MFSRGASKHCVVPNRIQLCFLTVDACPLSRPQRLRCSLSVHAQRRDSDNIAQADQNIRIKQRQTTCTDFLGQCTISFTHTNSKLRECSMGDIVTGGGFRLVQDPSFPDSNLFSHLRCHILFAKLGSPNPENLLVLFHNFAFLTVRHQLRPESLMPCPLVNQSCVRHGGLKIFPARGKPGQPFSCLLVKHFHGDVFLVFQVSRCSGNGSRTRGIRGSCSEVTWRETFPSGSHDNESPWVVTGSTREEGRKEGRRRLTLPCETNIQGETEDIP